jgi:hypothetical protein
VEGDDFEMAVGAPSGLRFDLVLQESTEVIDTVTRGQRVGIEIITIGHFPMKSHRRSLSPEGLSLGVDGLRAFTHIARRDRVWTAGEIDHWYRAHCMSSA